MKSEVIVPFEDQNYFMHSQHLDENLFQILGKRTLKFMKIVFCVLEWLCCQLIENIIDKIKF